MESENISAKYLKEIKREKLIISLVNTGIMTIGFSLLIFVLSLIAKI